MQVYFIDNDEFFKRKFIFTDENNELFDDNDGRAVFFAKGIVETVKKLKWRPDYIFVFDWFTSLLPLYIKTYYKNEPLFHDAKIFIVLTDETFEKPMSEEIKNKLFFDELPEEIIQKYDNPTEINLLKNAIDLADGVIIRTQKLPEEIDQHLKEKNIEVLDLSGIDLDENEEDLKAKFIATFEEESPSN